MDWSQVDCFFIANSFHRERKDTKTSFHSSQRTTSFELSFFHEPYIQSQRQSVKIFEFLPESRLFPLNVTTYLFIDVPIIVKDKKISLNE